MVFLDCQHVPMAFGGCCANCKWPDYASQCSVRDENWIWEEVDMGQLGIGQPHGEQQAITNLDPELGEAERPINLDPGEGDDGNHLIVL
ncbi:hypothetical protein BJX99DRAFT_229429 [Aspergillus californicus]